MRPRQSPEGGSQPIGRPRVSRGAIVLVLALSAASAAARGQQPQSVPVPALTEEVSLLSEGWALLAAGDASKASARAGAVLAKFPRSIAAAALFIEAEIARGGALAGLAAYETWLGSRVMEDGYLLRRAARALLWSATAKPEVAVEALQHLAADDDAEARAQLARRMVAGSLADTRALARIGDEGAVRRLIQQIESGAGSKMMLIDALVQSRSPLAIPTLTGLLKDVNYVDHVAAAADGLGTLGATSTIPQLRRLHEDSTMPGSVRFLAAAGLFKMNDMTGIALLQRQLTSEFAAVRSGAAEKMASQPDSTWMTVVRGLLNDPDPALRVKAAGLIAPYDLDWARQSLNSLLSDENPAIREIAGMTMVQRVAADFGALRRFLRSPEGSTQVAAAGRVLELTR